RDVGPSGEGVPRVLVDLGVILAPVVGHHEEHIVTARVRLAVDEEALLHRLDHPLLTDGEDVRMHRGVAYPTADVGLDYAQRLRHGLLLLVTFRYVCGRPASPGTGRARPMGRWPG